MQPPRMLMIEANEGRSVMRNKRKARDQKMYGRMLALWLIAVGAGAVSLYTAKNALAAPPENLAVPPESLAVSLESLAVSTKSGAASEPAPQGFGAGAESIQEPGENVGTAREKESAGLPDAGPERDSTPLVVIDAGHGGIDWGASAGDIHEKDINLDIALRVRDKLTELGYEVYLIRTGDLYLEKEARVAQANRLQADAYVSIHQNLYEDPQICGLETWYDGSDVSRDSERLARLVHKYAARSTGAQVRELRSDADFCVTGKTRMPACLIETGFLSNPEECALLVTPEYRDRLAEGIAKGIRLFFEPRTMYLTFDDGPTAENTMMVLDVLKERGICATFFLVGENVRKNPEVARRIAAEGHTIGIHCDCHSYDLLYESAEGYLEDFERAWQTVYEVTGVKAKLFRFPGGSINAYNKEVYGEIREKMEERGFVFFDWNASFGDAVKDPQRETLIQNAVESTLDRKKVVMLAHDTVRQTALCLDELLDQLPEYEMKPLTEYVKPIVFENHETAG